MEYQSKAVQAKPPIEIAPNVTFYNTKELGDYLKNVTGEYQDKDSAELADRFLNKYPDYNNLIKSGNLLDKIDSVNQPSLIQKIGDFGIGAGKGVLSTLRGASTLGENILRGTLKTVLPKSAEQALGIQTPSLQTPSGAQQLMPESMVTPTNGYQKAGFTLEQIAEYLVPSSGVAKLTKGLGLIPRALTEGAIVGGQTAIQQGKIDEEAKIATIAGVLFPVLGTLGKTAIKGTAGMVSDSILNSLIKPSKKIRASGYNVKNFSKYNLIGTDLEKTYAKTQVFLNQLGNEAKAIEKKLGGKQIDVLEALANVDKTARQKLSQGLYGVADPQSVYNQINKMFRVVEEVAGADGTTTFTNALNLRRSLGKMVNWADPNAKLINELNAKLYSELNKKLYKAASGTGLKEINKKFSEVIPLSDALDYRIEAAQNLNMLGITDSVFLTGSLLNPAVLAGWLYKKATQSPITSSILSKVENAVNKPATSAIGQRIFGSN